MSKRAVKSLTLLVLSALSALAIAADPPARVGRVAATVGQVSIGADMGADMNPAQVNWPVTTGNMITAAPGARTEVRIGSTSVRLDGDSSMEVLALDDDNIRLRLHYGSASVRVVNADVLRGFELSTPQGRIHLQQPGRVRIDTERVRDTTAVSVFDGVAEVEGAGSQLTVRAGKRALLTDDDVRTELARMDDFDNWSAARDRIDDNARSARYVSAEMTGYEDLDRYGSWREDSEYGSLWIPAVGADWVPYRDGSWTWIDPWGWTWVDNAPWGYAPFHYGRWVYVNRHWAWTPGRRAERLVWAPALVGWVGGAGWNVTFRDHHSGPGLGWYPLSPHDRFVPHYRASEDHLRWLNNHVRDDNRNRGRDYRPQGLTVVPQDRFRQPGRVNVPRAPIATVPPALVQNAPAGAPPAPNLPARPPRGPLADRDHDGRPDRFEGRPGIDRNGDGRPDRPQLGLIDRNHDGKPDYPQAGMIDRNHDGKPDQLQAGGFDRNRDGRPDRLQAGGIDRNGDGRPDRLETGRVERDGFVRQQRPQPASVQAQAQTPGLVPMPVPAQPQPVVSPTPHQPAQPLTITSPAPHVSPPPQPLTAVSPPPAPAAPEQGWQRQGRRDWEDMRRERGADGDERRERRFGPPPAANPAPAQPAAVMQAPVQQVPVRPPVMMPTPQQTVPEARAERGHREFERQREPVQERAREMAPPPQRVAPPPPPPAAAPAPAPVPAAARAERQERRESRGDERKHQENK